MSDGGGERILELVLNDTTCIPFEMATLIASNKAKLSASRAMADEVTQPE